MTTTYGSRVTYLRPLQARNAASLAKMMGLQNRVCDTSLKQYLTRINNMMVKLKSHFQVDNTLNVSWTQLKAFINASSDKLRTRQNNILCLKRMLYMLDSMTESLLRHIDAYYNHLNASKQALPKSNTTSAPAWNEIMAIVNQNVKLLSCFCYSKQQRVAGLLCFLIKAGVPPLRKSTYLSIVYGPHATKNHITDDGVLHLINRKSDHPVHIKLKLDTPFMQDAFSTIPRNTMPGEQILGATEHHFTKAIQPLFQCKPHQLRHSWATYTCTRAYKGEVTWDQLTEVAHFSGDTVRTFLCTYAGLSSTQYEQLALQLGEGDHKMTEDELKQQLAFHKMRINVIKKQLSRRKQLKASQRVKVERVET